MNIIALTVDGPLGDEKKIEDFHIVEMKKASDVLGTNLIAVLRLTVDGEPTDETSKLIHDLKSRMLARTQAAPFFLPRGVWSVTTPRDEWTRIADQLPEPDEDVLICREGEDWVIAGRYKPYWGIHDEIVFSDSGDCGLTEQPTHWRALPLPIRSSRSPV